MAAAGIPFAGILSGKSGSILRFYDSDESNYIGLKSPTGVGTSVDYTLPTVPASTNYLLTSTTGGVMSWLSTVPIDRGGTGADLSGTSGYSVFYMSPSSPAIVSTPPNLSTTPMFLKSLGNGSGSIVTFGFTQVGFTDLSGSITTAMISNDQVTFAKLQNVSNQRVVGRNTAGTGDAEEVTLTQLLDWIGSPAQGDILYRNATSWQRLAAGTNGHVLTTHGAAANPTWAAVSSGGIPGWETPTPLSFTSTDASVRVDRISLPTNSAIAFEVTVVAYDESSGGKGQARMFRGLCVTGSSGQNPIYYSPLYVTDLGSDAHAANEFTDNILGTSSISIGVSDTVANDNDTPAIKISTQGVAGTSIRWKVSIRYLTA